MDRAAKNKEGKGEDLFLSSLFAFEKEVIMNFLKLFSYVALLLCLIAVDVSADDGGYAGAFLRIGVGARPQGMGGAFIAIADDATATFWNPAGLGRLTKPQLASMYSLMSLERKHHFIGYAHPAGKLFVFGISWVNFSVSDIDGRDELGNPTEKFSDSENAFLFSIGKKMGSRLAIGSTIKWINHQLAGRKATGIGLDVGMMLKIDEQLHIAATLHDISTQIEWNTASRLNEQLLTVRKLGVAFTPRSLPLAIQLDIAGNAKQHTQYHLGIEYWVHSNVAARVGLDRKTPTLGASANIPIAHTTLELDYAFAPDVLKESPTHRMSLLLRF